MTDGTEADMTPRIHKKMDSIPSVKTHAKGSWFHHPMDLTKCRTQPTGLAVVSHCAPVTGLIVDQIGRVGQHRVHGCGIEFRQCSNAVGMNDGVRLYHGIFLSS